MKQTIKVREITKGCKFEFIDKGDFIDLRAAEDMEFKGPQSTVLKRSTNTRDVYFDFKLIPLGIALQLPKGYEAIIVSRSSTFKKFGLIQANAIGIIDYTYRGNNDEWKYPALSIRDTVIHKGDRICQFRIQLSQKATIWQKIKWIFTSGFKFEWVDILKGEDREGFGSTGDN